MKLSQIKISLILFNLAQVGIVNKERMSFLRYIEKEKNKYLKYGYLPELEPTFINYISLY